MTGHQKARKVTAQAKARTKDPLVYGRQSCPRNFLLISKTLKATSFLSENMSFQKLKRRMLFRVLKSARKRSEKKSEEDTQHPDKHPTTESRIAGKPTKKRNVA